MRADQLTVWADSVGPTDIGTNTATPLVANETTDGWRLVQQRPRGPRDEAKMRWHSGVGPPVSHQVKVMARMFEGDPVWRAVL